MAAEVPRLRPPGIDTHAFEPGGEDAQDELLPAAKPSYPYLVEHSNTGGRLTISSLDTDETLTWVNQHMVTASDWDVRRMNKDEGRGDPKDGLEPAFKTTSIKFAQKAIEPKRKPDGAAPMPPSRTRTNTPMQELGDEEKISEIERTPTRDSNNNKEEVTQDICALLMRIC